MNAYTPPEAGELWMVTIYDHPSNFPDGWVVRSYAVGAAGERTGQHLGVSSLAFARALVPELVPTATTCLPRWDVDDPTIVETWV